jgi:hypothetical protein
MSDKPKGFVRDFFDRVAEAIVTPDRNGQRRRGDGTLFSQPPKHATGYDVNRRDFLQPNFGDRMHQQSDGTWQTIQSHEVVRGEDGLFRPKYGNRPQRQSGQGSIPNNNENLGHDTRGGYYDNPASNPKGWTVVDKFNRERGDE